MNKALVTFLLAFCILGCKSSTAPAVPPAPGYLNSADQTLGESLAAVNAFANQEKINYAAEPATQKSIEKPYLNGLITATNLANAAYQAYHAGTQTLAEAQQALASAQSAQANLSAANGVK